MARKAALHHIPIFYITRSFHPSQDGYRIRRVVDISRLLSALETSPGSRVAFANGMDLLNCYLNTVPADLNRVRNIIETRDIELNVWHTLPDVDLVPGEALIRNLAEGRTQALNLGSLVPVDALLLTPAYFTPQLVQILDQCGIRSLTMLTNHPEAEQTSVNWVSGSYEILLTTYPDTTFDEFSLPPQKRAAVKTLTSWESSIAADASPNHLLLFERLHTDEDTLLPRVNEAVLKDPHFVSDGLKAAIDTILENDPERMRLDSEPSTAFRVMCAGCWSARIDLTNAITELFTTLTHCIEPFSAYAQSAACDHAGSIQALTAQLWQESLPLQSPEYIGGKCDDKTAEEGMLNATRLAQTAREIRDYTLRSIGRKIDTRHSHPEAIPIVVFNTAADPQQRLVDTEIILPETFIGLQLVTGDDSNTPLPYDLLPPESADGLPALRFVTPEIMPYGHTTVWVIPANSPPTAPSFDSHNVIENDSISVTLDENTGTITLYDKRTGRSFTGLNQYIDGADGGDLYQYQPSPVDSVIEYGTNYPLTPHCYRSDVEQILQYLQIYRLPRGLTADRSGRERLTAQFVPVSIQTTLRIPRHKPLCEVYVSIANQARDHRLQASFPTGIQSDIAWFDTAFGVVARTPNASYPGGRFVTLMGSETGLTLAYRGHPEVGLAATEQGVYVTKTLLRAFGTYSHTQPTLNGAESTQAQAEIEATYALIPHDADLEGAWRLARSFQESALAIPETQHNGTLRYYGSMIKTLSDGFLLSAIMRGSGEHDIIVRVVNLWDKPLPGTLEAAFRFDTVEAISPLGIPIERQALKHKKGTISFDAGPKEIVTLRFSGVRF